jgi:hypothetical protein
MEPHRDNEKELREKYPAIKAAYDQYQLLLKLTGEWTGDPILSNSNLPKET